MKRDDDTERPTLDARPPGHERPRGPASSVPTSGGSGRRDRAPADTDPIPLGHLSHEPPEAGTERTSRYWTGVEIARGGMGRVSEAIDTLLGRTVALKEALATDPDSLRRFARETKITARLEHPSIVPVYDAGTTPDGAPFYVMRKVTGRPLDELVHGAADLRARLALLPHVVAATQALAHAHERGVIHRDVKPSNILVGSLGETVVIDWGLAKVTGEPDDLAGAAPSAAPTPTAGDSLHTRAGVVFGTPGFMSPEQLVSADVDARADVYALGATLYYVLANELPHSAPSGDEIMAAAAQGPPAPLASRVRGVPAELATIVAKALAFDDRDRYPHAGALAEDLTRFLTGQLVASHRYSAGQRVGRFVRRYRAAVIAIAAALVALAAVAVLAIGRVVDARDDARTQAAAAAAAAQRETERADELVLSQARFMLDRDPTAAVAMARPLADGPHWREVHAIAAGAQAAGVAWRLPGAGDAIAVAIAPDGVQGAALAETGEVIVYDLAARTALSRVTLHDQPRFLRFVDHDRLVAWGGKSGVIVTLDLAAGRGKTTTLPAAIRSIVVSASRIYVVDQAGHGWQLETTAELGAEPTRIPLDDQLAALVPSPDGSRIAACGSRGLWLITAGPPQKLVDGATFTAAWDDAGQQVAVIHGSDIVVVTLGAPKPQIRKLDIDGRFALAMVHGVVYSVGLGGVAIEDRIIARRSSTDLGIQRAGAGEFVAGFDDGSVAVYDAHGATPILSPVHTVDSLATSRGSRRVLAAAAGAVLEWDLDGLLPAEVPVSDLGTTYGAVGPHGLYVSEGSAAYWLDLATGTRAPGPALPQLARVVDSGDGTDVALISFPGVVVLAQRGRADATPLGAAHGILAGLFVSPLRLVGADATGALTVFELAAGTARPLGALTAPPTVLRAAGDWIVARGEDGSLVRANVSAGTPAEQRPAAADLTSVIPLGDGRALVATGRQLAWWTPGQPLAPYVTLPHPVTDLYALDDAHAVARDEASSAYLIDLHAPAFSSLEQMVGSHLGRAPAAQLVAIPSAQAVRIVDVAGTTSWMQARGVEESLLYDLSPDGTRLFAMGKHAMLTWPLDVPVSAAATARWLDTLTNAHWNATTRALEW